MAGWLLEVSVVGVRALPLLAGRVLHALAHQVVAHVADALQRVREVRADLLGRDDQNQMKLSLIHFVPFIREFEASFLQRLHSFNLRYFTLET